MTLGPYASFIITSYLSAAIVVAILITWVTIDYGSQKRRLRELEESGIARLSGRSATDFR